METSPLYAADQASRWRITPSCTVATQTPSRV